MTMKMRGLKVLEDAVALVGPGATFGCALGAGLLTAPGATFGRALGAGLFLTKPPTTE
jgi:hypothetical protein